MLASLLPVTSVTALSGPVPTAAGAGSAASVGGAADFSGVLAAERAGGEKLPQPQDAGSPENTGGKSLPGAVDKPVSTDAAAEAGANGAAEARADAEGNRGADVRTSAQVQPKQGFPPASLQAQTPVAEGRAVLSGLPARAEPVGAAASERAIQQATGDKSLPSAGGNSASTDAAAEAGANPEGNLGAYARTSAQVADQEVDQKLGQKLDQKLDQEAEALPPPSRVAAPFAVQDESATQVEAVPQFAVATEGADITTDAVDGDVAAGPQVQAVINTAVNIAGAVTPNTAAMASAPAAGIQTLMNAIQPDAGQAQPPADIQTLMSAIQRDAGQALPPAVLRALQAQQAQDAGPRFEVAAAGVAMAAEPALAGPPPRLPGAELGPVPTLSTAPAPAPGLGADAGAEQASARLSMADGMVRLAGAAEAGVDAQGDDSALQAGMQRTGVEGTRAAQPLSPLATQLQSMPPGLSPGLSPGNAAWGQAISERVLLMTAGSLQLAEIRLDPPELGTLHVRLQLNQDQASLSFTSPHAQVRDALEQQMPRLRDMLAEQGLNLESSSVADDSERRERSAPGAGGGAGLMVEQDEDPAATVAPVVRASRSLVDDYA
jgi:hypothetical protein